MFDTAWAALILVGVAGVGVFVATGTVLDRVEAWALKKFP